MRAKKIQLAITFALGLLIALSCQPAPATEKKTIVVTYSVLGSVVRDLVGDKAAVIVSVPNGQDPHDWLPSARDIQTINQANLVVENGLGLENGMQKTLAAARNRGVRLFTASDYITVRHVGPGEGIPSGDPDQALGAADPHLWTDPVAIKNVVVALAPVLTKELGLDLSSQATDLENRMDSLNKEIADKVSVLPQQERKLVTGHESMGYFGQRYGFKLIGVIVPSLSSQAEVSAADMAALKQAIQQNHVKAIFTELGTSPAVAKTIGDETGGKVIELATHALPPDGSYFTFMRNLADVIVNGLK